MKTFFIYLSVAIIAISLAIYPEFAKTYSSMLTFNSENHTTLPRTFRTTPLNASGSAQFSRKGLQEMLTKIPRDNIIIVDLRAESHGFMNGAAVSWYADRNWLNAGKDKKTIIREEVDLLHNLSTKKFALIFKHRTYPTFRVPRQVMTEKELTKRHDVGYLRLPVRDHVRPADETVDEFVEFISQLPEGTWLHFHCSAGKGRTTTFLSMYDMLLHAQTVGFDEIMTRQEEWGGTDLLKDPVEAWKRPYQDERIVFLQQFHRYCAENPQPQVKWSEWVKQRTPGASESI